MKLYLRGSNRPHPRPHPNQAGFTLVELVVAVTVAVLVLGFSVALVGQQRRQFVLDRARNTVSQTLRTGMDLVGADIRQVGENISDTTLPIISVRDNTPNPGQVLVLQRKLASVAELTLCQTPTGNQLIVSSATDCMSASNLTLMNWRNFRCNGDESNATPCTRTTPVSTASSCVQKGGADKACLWAYIHDPSNNRGEFFLVDLEVFQAGGDYLNRIDGTAWTNPSSYVVTPLNRPRIYLLEEREYQLVPDTNTVRTDDYTLQLTINRQADNIQRLVNQLSDFQVAVQMPTGLATLPFNFVGIDPTAITNWKPVQNIQVTLNAVNFPDAPSNKPLDTSSQVRVPDANLTLVSQFFPRNSLSNPQ